jgi:AcrR family transcriptional regulator
MTSPSPDPSRRNEHSRRAILTATVALIGEIGYAKASIEAIAQRAGVGKQTIYRWWPSKGAVALEALNDSLATAVDVPDSGDILEDLRIQMKGVMELFESTELGRIYRELLAAAQSDPVLSGALLDQLIEPTNEARLARITLAQERGELRADVDPQVLVDMLYGAIYWRMMLFREPLAPEQVDAALDIAFRGVR